MTRLHRILILCLAVCVIGSGCSREKDGLGGTLRDGSGLLRYVPADTPYLVVTPGDVPEDVADKFEPQVDVALKAYGTILRSVFNNAQVTGDGNADGAAARQAMEPFVDGLVELMSVEGMRSAGIDRDTDVALYGVGLLPVLRLSLSSGELMQETIADLESRAGETMRVGSIDDTSYRYVGDESARFIISVTGNEFVVSIVPGEISDSLLRRVLGLELPDQNIAGTGLLAQAAERHELADYMIGIVDFERLADAFLTVQSGVNAELHRLMDHNPSEISDVCRSEMVAMAGIAPRLVTGYTNLSVSHIASKLVIELREDIAAGIAAMVGPVPGLGSHSGGLMSFGVGIDLLASREFYADQLQKLDESPYQCEWLSDFQSDISAGRETLNSPVPPIVYGIKGFLAEISSLEGGDIANGLPPTSVDMRMILATDNAEGLVAMGAMFSPDLMALNLEPDGKPVRLDMPQIQATGQTVHLAMTDSGLGISVGDGMEQGLPDMLNAPVSEQAPFLAMDMDAARYYAMMNEAISREGGDLDNMPEIKSAVSDLMNAAQSIMERVSFEVRFSDAGIEAHSEIILQD